MISALVESMKNTPTRGGDEVAVAAKLASRLVDKANAKVQNKVLNGRLNDKYGKR